MRAQEEIEGRRQFRRDLEMRETGMLWTESLLMRKIQPPKNAKFHRLARHGRLQSDALQLAQTGDLPVGGFVRQNDDAAAHSGR